MTTKERINEYAKTVYQLFWQVGVTDVLKMLVTTLDFIYLRRKFDTDPYAFNEDDTCLWGNLCIYDKERFENIYMDKLYSFFFTQKKYDFACVDSLPSSLEYQEFSEIYELFHLTDELFKDVMQIGVDESDNTLHGLIFEELVEAWGILRQIKNALPKHMAKLLCSLVDVTQEDFVYIPNCGIGELPLNAFKQVLLRKLPKQRLKEDADGFYVFDKADTYMLSMDRWNTTSLTVSEKNETVAYLCAMNFYLHGMRLRSHIDIKDFYSQSYVKKQKNKFSRILSVLVEKETAVRILGIKSIMEMLAPNGRAAVVVPESFLFSRDSKTVEYRHSLLVQNSIDAVISLPKGTLIGSNVKLSILILSKNTESPATNIWFCDLFNDGYAKTGKRQRNTDFPLPKLVDNYRLRLEERTNLMYSIQVPVRDVIANNSLLAINYYKEMEPVMKEFVDPNKILTELFVLEGKIKTGLEELYKML